MYPLRNPKAINRSDTEARRLPEQPARRDFLRQAAAGAAALALPLPWSRLASAEERLPTRPIPGTGEALPVIGLGNSNAFRQDDVPASRALIELFHRRGGAYIDCSGPSRFTVAGVAQDLGIGSELFLGTYFTGEDEAAMRANIGRLLQLLGRERLDLVHSYPEFAVPNWTMFRRWKDEGLTRYIGVARHRSEYYGMMMRLMKTGTVDFLQVNYSLLETEAEERVLPMAMDMGVAVTCDLVEEPLELVACLCWPFVGC